MDISPLKDWLAVIGSMVAVGTAIYAILTARASKALSEVARIDHELSAINARVLKVETSIEHMPSREDLQRLEGIIQSTDRVVVRLEERMVTLVASVERIQSFLDKRG